MTRGIVLVTLVCALSGCGDGAATDARDGSADGSADGTGDGATGDGSSSDGASNDGATGDGSSGGEVWKPALGTSWQWQLTGALDTSLDVAMYDVDLFTTSASDIAALQAEGRVVICYYSAGTREDYRDDADDFMASDFGKALPEWEGETWLDVRSANVRTIMEKRMDVAVEKGCDGLEPDNVDGYDNDSGFELSEQDQLDYNRWLADQAHTRGLSVGLKNALGIVAALEPSFDWALNEECLAFEECNLLAPFVDANKAVFHTEYVDELGQAAAKRDEVCGEPSIAGFSTLVKTWDLGPEFFPCP